MSPNSAFTQTVAWSRHGQKVHINPCAKVSVQYTHAKISILSITNLSTNLSLTMECKKQLLYSELRISIAQHLGVSAGAVLERHPQNTKRSKLSSATPPAALRDPWWPWPCQQIAWHARMRPVRQALEAHGSAVASNNSSSARRAEDWSLEIWATKVWLIQNNKFLHLLYKRFHPATHPSACS